MLCELIKLLMIVLKMPGIFDKIPTENEVLKHPDYGIFEAYLFCLLQKKNYIIQGKSVQ